MFGKNFDLSKQIVLDTKPTFESKSGFVGKAVIEKYTPDVINIRVNAVNKGLLLLTDSYYPGWEAKVDGISTLIYRADYSFRAIEVPQGNHEIEFSYFPPSFRIGIYLAIIGLLGIVGFGFFIKKKN
jgi:uncharacterized membrane protein YfhO